MNRLVYVAISMLCMPLMASCGSSGSGRVFADAIWQARCPSTLMGCASDGDPHDVFGFDGDEFESVDGVTTGLLTARCDLVELPDDSGNATLSFRAQVGGANAYSVEVQNAVVNLETGGMLLGSGCFLRLLDDSVTYQGGCGANAPSEAQPCQLGPVTVDPNGEDGRELRTTILCEALPSPSGPTVFQRDLEQGRDVSRGTPAPIRFINCGGV